MQNYPYMPFRLYNLEADSREQTNGAAWNRPVVEELAGYLREHLRRAGSVPWQGGRR
jgi:hypothetical protein